MGKKKPARLSGNTVSGFATLLASLECIVQIGRASCRERVLHVV